MDRDDHYNMTTTAPPGVSFPGMLILVFAASLLLRLASNKLRSMSRERMQKGWREDAEEAEIRVELFGLGRYMGYHGDPNSNEIPLDIIDEISEKYDIQREKLVRPFVRGLLDGREEKKASGRKHKA